jgi:hypothetical protein
MSLYLVIHTPIDEGEVAGDNDAVERPVQAPSRLTDLANASVGAQVTPRWLKTWSPDLHDDRIFSLWDADDAAQITEALERFGFLNDRTAQPIRVHEWGPADVLVANQ